MKIKKGFTLIELLIVISVIGILTGVLISILNPSLFQGRAFDARRSAVLSDIGTAAESYYAEIGSYPTSTSLLTPYLKNSSWPVDVPRTGNTYVLGSDTSSVKFCVYTACSQCGRTYLKYVSNRPAGYSSNIISSNVTNCP